MFKTFPVVLDITKHQLNDMFQVNSNDLNTVKLSMSIKSGLDIFDLTGKVVRIAIKKPDGFIAFQTGGVIDPSNGLCEFILDRQAYLVEGKHEAEVMIYQDDSTVVVTERFYYKVNRAIVNDKTLLSTNHLPAINQAIIAGEQLQNIDIPEFVDAANGAFETIEEAETQGIYAKDQGDYAKQEADKAALRTTELNGVDAVQFNDRLNVVSLGTGAIPEQFPKLTGEPDDTLMIQRAIDSLSSGGKLVLTKKYNITTINAKSNLIIEGVGQEKSGLVSSSNVVINVPNGSVRFSFNNFGIWGNVANTVGIDLAGGAGGIADFSIRDMYIKSCLTGLHCYFAWGFSVDRVRFQDCINAINLESQTNQGNFTACSFKVKTKVATFINCNAINFIGCEFAGNSHDGTIPITLYQSVGINLKGCYVEYFADNTPLMTIGTLTSALCSGISIEDSYISHITTGEMVKIYGVNGLKISNNNIRKATIGFLINDMMGNAKGVVMEGNSGYEVERGNTNLVPNYGFFAWNAGENAFPDGVTPTTGSVTASRDMTDGSLKVVTTTATQGSLHTLNEKNLDYITLELEQKTDVDAVMYIDFLIDGAYTYNTGISIYAADGYKKLTFIKKINGGNLTGIRFRYSVLGVRNMKTLRAYRGVVEVDKDRNPSLMSSVPPTHGTFIKTQEIKNTNPVSGGYEKWKPITAGVANNRPWVASTAYTLGQRVNANNKVYEATVAGTSGTTAPSHTTGTATDGTVTWSYIGVLAVFEPFGVIGETQTVLKSLDGSRYKITVGNDGALTTTKL